MEELHDILRNFADELLNSPDLMVDQAEKLARLIAYIDINFKD